MRRLLLIQRFTSDNTITEKIREEAEKKLKTVFSTNDSADSEVRKYLKNQPIDGLLKEFPSYKADEIAYAVELGDKLYLDWLSKHIEKSLENENLTFQVLDPKVLDVLRQKTFTDLYNSWSNTVDKSELEDKLKKEVEANVTKWDDLIAEAKKTVADDLKNAKEKYKKGDISGEIWSLTEPEKSRIDRAANKQDLEKAVREIMEERKVDNWIKDKISSKTKVEELPTEAAIDSDAEIPTNAKEQVKWKLQEKKIELMLENNAKGKIKKHLTEVKFKWEKWIYLVKQKVEKDPTDYSMALMFDKDFGKTVAEEMLPKITAAIAKDTIEDYQILDKEWGQNILEDDRAKYNEDRDYYEVWKDLRKYLHEEKVNKDEWMKVNLKGFYGEDKFKEVERQYQELQAQIELLDNK